MRRGGKAVYLGSYATPEEAALRYARATAAEEGGHHHGAPRLPMTQVHPHYAVAAAGAGQPSAVNYPDYHTATVGGAAPAWAAPPATEAHEPGVGEGAAGTGALGVGLG